MLLFDTRLGGDAEAEHVAAYTSRAILAEPCNWSRWCIPSSRVAIQSRGRAGDGNAHCAHTLNSAPEPPVRGASGMFGTGETPVPQCEMMADWRLTSSSGLAHPTRKTVVTPNYFRRPGLRARTHRSRAATEFGARLDCAHGGLVTVRSIRGRGSLRQC